MKALSVKKRILGLGMAMLMACALCANAFAADTESVSAGRCGTLTGYVSLATGTYRTSVTTNPGVTIAANAEIKNSAGSTLRSGSVSTSNGTSVSGTLSRPAGSYSMYGSHTVNAYSAVVYTYTNS